MNYNNLLEAHLKYGTTKEDIYRHKVRYEIIPEIVVEMFK